MELLSTIFVSIVSVVLGFFISTWRNRLLPWIAILQFSETQRNPDKVKIDRELYLASKQAWEVNQLNQDEDTLSAVSDCLATVKEWLRQNTDTESKINDAIHRISSAKSDDEIIMSIFDLLEPSLISFLIEECTRRGKISPTYLEADEEKIKYYVSEKYQQGCFILVFQESSLSFGSRFNEFPHRRDSLLPFMKTISRLNKQNIVEILQKLIPPFKEQREINNALAEKCQKIVDDNMRWHCEFIITNFGATPFILFPETSLCIVGKHIKPFSINSELQYRTPEDEKNNTWSPSKGFRVIQLGETQRLALVTYAQQKIDGAGVIKGGFRSGDCNGYIKLQITGREMPWKTWVRSAQLPFREFQQ